MITKEEIMQIAATIAETLKRTVPLHQKEMLTTEEACEYTGLSINAIYKLTHRRQIPYYKPNGGKCFFKRAELDRWMMSCRVATSDELDAKAAAYCLEHPL